MVAQSASFGIEHQQIFKTKVGYLTDESGNYPRSQRMTYAIAGWTPAFISLRK